MAEVRAATLRQAQEFFARRSVLEVSTPALAATAAMDPNIASVRATLAGRETYLQTSPEYHMKRLLAAGYPDIYQVSRVFRDGESGRNHLPEFTLVEWYRRAFDLDDMISETVDFITLMIGSRLHETEHKSISYCHAFRDALKLDPLQSTASEIAQSMNAGADLRDKLGEDREAWLDLAMATHVAATFSKDALTVIHHYPISQASLARQCPDDASLADRFEVFFGTLELANGFVELGDAATQLARFEADNEVRRHKELPVHQIDQNLLSALQSGLPACAGVAVGLERLLMLRVNATHIRDVVTFSPGT